MCQPAAMRRGSNGDPPKLLINGVEAVKAHESLTTGMRELGARPPKLIHRGGGTGLAQTLSYLGGSTGHLPKLITASLGG